MTTIDVEITSARYDLRDEDLGQYSTPLLLDYYNRVLPALASHLGSLRSDWVFGDATLTVSSGSSTVALPSSFASPIKAQIDDSDLIFDNTREIKTLLQQTSAGTPEYYGVHKLDMIFEREVSADTAVYIQYNEKEIALKLGDSMPYNDEFNHVLRAAVVMMAKNRNEKDITGDFALKEAFNASGMQRLVKRSFKQKTNLGF